MFSGTAGFNGDPMGFKGRLVSHIKSIGRAVTMTMFY